MRVLIVSFAACLAAAAWAQQQPASQGQSPARSANPDRNVTVSMMDAKGRSVGTVEVRQLGHGTVFISDLKNLPPGPHGFHIHERGVCDPPQFTSAGDHYSPQNKKHGFDSAQGYHAGDLPNIHVTQQGSAKAEFHSARLTLERQPGAKQAGDAGPFVLMDQDGSAIMIHAKGDDYQASTPDSTGDRVACGVIKAP